MTKLQKSVFQHVLHIFGNSFRRTFFFSNSLTSKTVKKYRMTIEEKTGAVGMLVSELFYDRLYSL